MSLAPAPAISLDRVEWRVDGKPTGEGGNTRCRFVPYLDARDIAALLDDWVGPGNWSDAYEPGEIAGKPAMWCHLSIRVGDDWVTKTDVGVPSNFEGQKGAVSDSFKRAGCLKWGVGRNVYELPTLWAPCRVDNKGNTWPNDQSLPSIRKQLAAAGLSADGGRVAAPEGVDAETGEIVTEVEAVPASVADEWLERMNQIGDGRTRTAVKNRFGKEFGKPHDVHSDKATVVDAWIDTELARIAEPPDTELSSEAF